jgi:hypothetical protein
MSCSRRSAPSRRSSSILAARRCRGSSRRRCGPLPASSAAGSGSNAATPGRWPTSCCSGRCAIAMICRPCRSPVRRSRRFIVRRHGATNRRLHVEAPPLRDRPPATAVPASPGRHVLRDRHAGPSARHLHRDLRQCRDGPAGDHHCPALHADACGLRRRPRGLHLSRHCHRDGARSGRPETTARHAAAAVDRHRGAHRRRRADRHRRRRRRHGLRHAALLREAPAGKAPGRHSVAARRHSVLRRPGHGGGRALPHRRDGAGGVQRHDPSRRLHLRCLRQARRSDPAMDRPDRRRLSPQAPLARIFRRLQAAARRQWLRLRWRRDDLCHRPASPGDGALGPGRRRHRLCVLPLGDAAGWQ